MAHQQVKRKILFLAFALILGFSFLSFGGALYNIGLNDGVGSTLMHLKETTDLEFEWSRNEDGSYTIKTWDRDNLINIVSAKVDLIVEHYRDGILLSSDKHAGVLTNLGKDWLEVKISGTQNVTQIAKYISTDDTDSSGLSVDSIQLTSENNAYGLERAAGTYASTGVGTWTVAKAFSVTGTISAQTYGLQWDSFPMNGNSLLCYDTSAIKNCVNGDTLTVTWTISVS